ncbi:NtaA/DmoA family FMN-dependent monooxygenase [Pseudonocardia kujensis]|uniref:NtaA/DmoA family FMN-dependent monooxygenase n=1 Tax=Pseudonocardia kujensis TaxID=1128675 RepID=UPI001E65C3F2|nr:NtaA/DmoA family FMN-dependent monooxygenase [Pseudonocardia kujensis]MCE0765037.1 NtaA/DmoA family FMN-dependent monooxygenase [Pseudonocardia kujensis]
MKPLTLGVFEHLNPNGMSGATWRHPDNVATRYLDLDHWTRLARRVEAADLDFLFLADSYGMPIVDGAVPDAAVRSAVHFPSADPFAVVGVCAAATSTLGIVVTSSTVFEEPYANARRYATLDHLTRGRIGWNVVTSASAASAAAMFGRPLTPHDTRYDMAEDYMELSYRLLEGSWEDGAVLADKEAGVYADPARVHDVDHKGPYFSARGVFPVEASPQRVPVLFQAGSSGRGREFAARHAECVFLQGTTVPRVAEAAADIRSRAEAFGRDGDAIRLLVGLTIIVAPTTAEAETRYATFRSFSTDETAAAQFAFNTGIDLLSLDPGAPLPADIDAQQGQSNVDRFRPTDGSPAPTVRAILDELKARGLRGLVLHGTPDVVAQQMQDYAEATGIDGFLLESYLNPGTYDELIDLLLPELRRRGIAPGPHRRQTLRERLGGAGRHLPDSHPAAAHRVGAGR